MFANFSFFVCVTFRQIEICVQIQKAPVWVRNACKGTRSRPRLAYTSKFHMLLTVQVSEEHGVTFPTVPGNKHR